MGADRHEELAVKTNLGSKSVAPTSADENRPIRSLDPRRPLLGDGEGPIVLGGEPPRSRLWAGVAIGSLVAICLGVIVAVSPNYGADADPAGPDRRVIGPISAEIPDGWARSGGSPDPQRVEFASEDGTAETSFRVGSGEGEDLRSLVRAAGKMLTSSTEFVVIEDEKFGEKRATVIASADDVEFNATVRVIGSRALIAIVAIDVGASDEVASEAVSLAQSARVAEGLGP